MSDERRCRPLAEASSLVPHDQSVRRCEKAGRLFAASNTLVLDGFILAIVL
jgi:hypothetical protein